MQSTFAICNKKYSLFESTLTVPNTINQPDEFAGSLPSSEDCTVRPPTGREFSSARLHHRTITQGEIVSN